MITKVILTVPTGSQSSILRNCWAQINLHKDREESNTEISQSQMHDEEVHSGNASMKIKEGGNYKGVTKRMSQTWASLMILENPGVFLLLTVTSAKANFYLS